MKTKHYDGVIAVQPATSALYAHETDDMLAACCDGEFPAKVNDANAIRFRDCWNATLGLDLPEDLPPGTLARAVDTLMKWHNWIASGQLNFREDHLAESTEILKALGRPAMEMKGEPVSPEKPACPHCGGRDVEDRTTQEIATWGEGEAHCKTCNREFRFELPKDKPEGYFEKCRRETAEYHAAKQATVSPVSLILGNAPVFTDTEVMLIDPPEPGTVFLRLPPAEKQLVLGLVEAGIATHDDLPPGDNIFRRKSEEMLPVYQSIKSKLETP